jgi:hypothetical protein
MPGGPRQSAGLSWFSTGRLAFRYRQATARAHTGGMAPRTAGTRRVLSGSPFNVVPATLPPPESFSVGDRVSHDRYGLGRVVSLEEQDVAVVVDFGSALRRVTLPSAKLTKL